MSRISFELIKKIREGTGAPVVRVKKVLEAILGNLPADATRQALQAGEKKAIEVLKKEGFEKAEERSEKQTSQGLVETYIHHSGKVASMVEVLCETDFVARNELFKALAHNIALQVASMNPKNFKELEGQEFIKDPTKKIADLVKEVIAKTGENIKIGRYHRIEIGK